MLQIDKIIFWLICLMPPALVSGPLLADSFVIIVDILVLIKIFEKKKFDLFKNRFFIFFIIFYLILIASSLFSENIYYSLRSSIPYIRHGIFVLAVIYIIKQDSKFLKTFYYILFGTFSLLVIDGFIQYLTGTNIFGIHHPHPDRITSLFGDELKLGSFLSRLLPLLIGLIIFFGKKKKFYISFLILLIILVDTLIYVSLERTAFFLTMISTIYIILFSKNLKLIRFICFTVTLLIILLISLNDDITKGRMINQPIEAIEKSFKQKIFLTKFHDSMYKTSFKMFKSNLLLGVGPKMFRKDCRNKKYYIDKNSCNTHPHNTYIQLLAETGILGFGMFFIFVIFILQKTFNHFKNLIMGNKNYLSDFKICILATIFITIWPFTTSGNFFNNWLSIMYFIPIGFLYSKFKDEEI